MSVNKKKQRSDAPLKQGDPVGIPVKCMEKGGTVILKVDEFLRLREQWTAVSKAMRKLDVLLGLPSETTDGFLYAPTYFRDEESSEDDGTNQPAPPDLKTKVMAATNAGVEGVMNRPGNRRGCSLEVVLRPRRATAPNPRRKEGSG